MVMDAICVNDLSILDSKGLNDDESAPVNAT